MDVFIHIYIHPDNKHQQLLHLFYWMSFQCYRKDFSFWPWLKDSRPLQNLFLRVSALLFFIFLVLDINQNWSTEGVSVCPLVKFVKEEHSDENLRIWLMWEVSLPVCRSMIAVSFRVSSCSQRKVTNGAWTLDLTVWATLSSTQRCSFVIHLGYIEPLLDSL